MPKFIGVSGSGNVGREPLSPRSFSGSSRNLFAALERRDALGRAFGVEVGRVPRHLLMLRNFRRSRSDWRLRFYLDTGYYRALTRAVARAIRPADLDGIFLQLGAYYDVPSIVAGRARCTSYHDGNVAQLMASPYVSSQQRRAAEKAFAWERQVYEGLDAIFTMSEYLRRSFIDDFGIPAARVWNVGAGANFEVPSDLPPKDYGPKKVLFIGIDFHRKGGPELLRAFQKVRELHSTAELHIVGPRTRPTMLESHSSGVTYHGFLSRQDPLQREVFFRLMQESTVFAMPSRFEPYGIAVLEAMVYGMPAVATDRWAFPEMIGDAGATVEPGDVEGLVDRLDWLLSDEGRREELGARARKRVLDSISWDNVAARMIETARRL